MQIHLLIFVFQTEDSTQTLPKIKVYKFQFFKIFILLFSIQLIQKLLSKYYLSPELYTHQIMEPLKTENTFKDLDPTLLKVPFELYPLQKRMIKLIFDAVSKKKSLVIESPTGTGKTMCLLSATLEAVKQKGIQRVYYLTRTHTQMNGIIEEIKKTCYQPNFVVAQSKKALCVHTAAIVQGANLNIQEFNDLCFHAQRTGQKSRQIIDKCPMRVKLQPQKLHFPPIAKINNQKDIRKYSQSQGYCPEKYQSLLSRKAEVIIMPYIYMLNTFISRSKSYELQNSVLLFDEAHNILEMAKNQSSPTINNKIIQSSKSQLQTLKILTQAQILSNPKAPDLHNKFQVLQKLSLYLEQLAKMREELKKIYFKRRNSVEQAVIISLQEIKKITKFSLKDFILFRTSNSNVMQGFSSQLKRMQQGKKKRYYINALINTCYKVDEMFNNSKYQNEFICALYNDKNSKEQKFKIKFYCLTSKLVFDRLKTKNNLFIFASGTLNISDFKDTGLDFINNFTPLYPGENPYPNNNVQTFQVNKYQFKDLNIDFKNPNYDSVASYLQEIIPSIPNGVLVFFKSYSYLVQFKNYISQRYINFGKQVFFEEQKSNDFQQKMTKYKETAMSKGAILFGCMRGKASQGCNFQNSLARAVFIIGMPFGNLHSIDAKIHEHLGNFQKWYIQEAMLAMSQAIGRVVRHRNDFGLVFLLGKRVCQMQKKFPKWLQYSAVYKNISIGQTKHQISKFFLSKNNSMPAPMLRQQLDDMVDDDQMIRMWDGQDSNQDYQYDQVSNRMSSEVSSVFQDSDFKFKNKQLIQQEQFEQNINRRPLIVEEIQPTSDQQEQLQLLLALDRSKKQM